MSLCSYKLCEGLNRTPMNLVKKFLSSPLLLGILALAILIIHTFFAFYYHEDSFVQRGGSLIILTGLVITGRPVIRLGYAKWYVLSRIIDGGEPDNTPTEQDIQEEYDARCTQLYGPVTVVLGTIINGYGDKLYKLLRDLIVLQRIY